VTEALNAGCQQAIESFHRRHDNVMSSMEELVASVRTLTDKVENLETLLQQALQQPRVAPPAPQQQQEQEQEQEELDEEEEESLEPPPPQRTVNELDRTPQQPTFDRSFPKNWSALLRMWRNCELEKFVTVDARMWDHPVAQAYQKRKYLIDHLRDRCRTTRGALTQEAREDAAAEALDVERGIKTLRTVSLEIHRLDGGIRRRKRRRTDDNDEEDEDNEEPQQPAIRPQQRRRRRPQGIGRARQEQGRRYFENWPIRHRIVPQPARRIFPPPPPLPTRVGPNPFANFAATAPLVPATMPMQQGFNNRGQGARAAQYVAQQRAERERNLRTALLRRSLNHPADVLNSEILDQFNTI
jgi:hypothetical protein